MYRINLIAIEEEAILLRHLAEGSEAFCRSHRIRGDRHPASDWRQRYRPWFETVIWDRMFYLAARLRSAFDAVDFDRHEDPDPGSFKEFNPIAQSIGPTLTSWRALFNKVVHADSHFFIWRNLTHEGRWAMPIAPDAEFCEWDGVVSIDGVHQSQAWHYGIDIRLMADGMAHLARCLGRQTFLLEE